MNEKILSISFKVVGAVILGLVLQKILKKGSTEKKKNIETEIVDNSTVRMSFTSFKEREAKEVLLFLLICLYLLMFAFENKQFFH